MERVNLTPAFVLHRRPYSNTSLIVDLFTRDYGRVGVMARGARRPKSRYRGQLEPFFPLLASWVGRHELKTLGALEFERGPYPLTGRVLLCGFYLNELLLRLLPREDAHPKLFAAYQAVLAQLAQATDVQVPLRCFEKRLLHELGYGLPLGVEFNSNQPIQAEHHYQYIPQQGFVLAALNPSDHYIFVGKSLLALQQEQFTDITSLNDAKRLMRLALAFHLGGRPLKSRELLR